MLRRSLTLAGFEASSLSAFQHQEEEAPRRCTPEGDGSTCGAPSLAAMTRPGRRHRVRAKTPEGRKRAAGEQQHSSHIDMRGGQSIDPKIRGLPNYLDGYR